LREWSQIEFVAIRVKTFAAPSPILQSDRDILLLQKLFHVADGVGAKMENARGEDGVGAALHIP
jgi:hypothetical protein